MKENEKNSVFDVLNSINVNGHTEKKKTGSTELTYLSWSWAWAEVKKRYPDAEYSIYRDEHNKPYVEDEDFGLMCYTSVTIQGQTYEMWLPVMNGANKAMRRTAYTYQVWNSYKKIYEEKTVEAATMFDINKTIMRCLVKNLAMFGLGLYIYSGEDIPDNEADSDSRGVLSPKEQKGTQTNANEDELYNAFKTIEDNIKTAPSRDELQNIHAQNEGLWNYKPFTDALNKRWSEVA